VTAISGSNVTVDQDVSVFAAGTTVYGAFTYSPALGEYATYLGFNVERDGYSRLYAPARVTEMELSKVAAKEGCRMKFGFMAPDWQAGFTPASPPTDAFRANPAMVGIGSPCAVRGITTVLSDFSFKFGVKHEESPSLASSNGRQAYVATDFPDCSGAFTEYYSDSRFTSDLRNGTSGPLRFSIENPTTGIGKARASYGLWIPNASIKVARATIGNQIADKVSFRANAPTAAQVTAGITKPFYFGVVGGE